ncbi:MAG TPA: hypothetical protein VIM07_04435, partial [Chitinophagaceae bacterium]
MSFDPLLPPPPKKQKSSIGEDLLPLPPKKKGNDGITDSTPTSVPLISQSQSQENNNPFPSVPDIGSTVTQDPAENKVGNLGQQAGFFNFGMPSISDLTKQQRSVSDNTLDTHVANSINNQDFQTNGAERIKVKNDKIQEAIKNTAEKYLKIKGIANPNPSQLNEQIKVGQDALQRGDV